MSKIYLVDSNLLFTVEVEADSDQTQPFPYDGRRKKPPVTGFNEIARSLGYDPDDDWEVIPDYRGLRYWVGEQEAVVLEAGVLLPAGASLERPLSLLKLDKASEMSAECRSQIVAGFTSAALGGVAHTYPSRPTDQINLAGSIIDAMASGTEPGWVTSFWCALDGVWAWRPHTAEQIIQVGRDGKVAVMAAQGRNAQRQAQIAAAASPAALADIAWEDSASE